jgi:hypothetical protein
MSSALQGPKKTPAGYFLALRPPVHAPELRWSAGAWQLSPEWASWASDRRKQLLGELLAHPTWFSRPPRQDILDPIFGPWSARTMAGIEVFATKTPAIPGEASGKGTWALQGLLMSSASIDAVWEIASVTPDPTDDCISLFGDGETVDGSSDGDTDEDGTREIQLEDIADCPPAAEPTRLRNREWEARKFLGKERVREARLKAQIARRLADKEEQRYYAQFGDLDDNESHFSEYDLTDEERSSGSSDAESEH